MFATAENGLIFAVLRAEEGQAEQVASLERGRAAFLARVTAAQKALADDPNLLADRPHPKLAIKSGLTARDYTAWLIGHARHPGLLTACKLVENALDEMVKADVTATVVDLNLYRRQQERRRA